MKLRNTHFVIAIFTMLCFIKTCEAQQVHSAALVWGASSTSLVTYNIYRALGSGSPLVPGAFTKVGNTANLTYTDATLASNTSYCYNVTAFDGTNESVPTNTICGTTNKDVQPPSGTPAFTIIFK